jgi:hypothetical protein
MKKLFEKVWSWLKNNTARYLILLFGLTIICYIIFSSNPDLKTITKPADLYSLISPSLIFLVVLAIKLLAGFWIFVITVSIFNWKNVSEQGAKIFGVEISHKFNRQEIDEARAGVTIVKKQMKI